MKSKSIPADIKLKSIKEAQHEIKEIITNLENVDANLEESIDKYNRMMQLNNYIQEEFKQQLKQIKELSFKNKKNSTKN